ncbi:MAG TPA: DUF1512 domain-containing protein, partial [Aquificaceae bacterium]|nr:DUF1512 domain-containing protein [Aquificaceae bacterium]
MPEPSLPEWISAVSQLLFILIFLALFLGFNQRFQVYMWSRDIKSKLLVLNSYASEARERALDFLVKHKAQEPKRLMGKVMEFFIIEPVTIEPVDIIRRLDHLINIRQSTFREDFERALPGADHTIRTRAETAAEIASALNFIYKYVRHLLLLGEKTRNWILIMQLQLAMPLILRIAETYRRALNDFINGVPIGDAAGPLTVVKLLDFKAEWREVERDTLVGEGEIEGRRVLAIKAKGPGSTVGKPGTATESVIRDLVSKGVKPKLLLTIDAALKLEGEESGSVAEGVGAAIGDIGPEKIRFERIASSHVIPLMAIVIKMSMEEAIQGITKKVYEGVERAVEMARSI